MYVRFGRTKPLRASSQKTELHSKTARENRRKKLREKKKPVT